MCMGVLQELGSNEDGLILQMGGGGLLVVMSEGYLGKVSLSICSLQLGI